MLYHWIQPSLSLLTWPINCLSRWSKNHQFFWYPFKDLCTYKIWTNKQILAFKHTFFHRIIFHPYAIFLPGCIIMYVTDCHCEAFSMSPACPSQTTPGIFAAFVCEHQGFTAVKAVTLFESKLCWVSSHWLNSFAPQFANCKTQVINRSSWWWLWGLHEIMHVEPGTQRAFNKG